VDQGKTITFENARDSLATFLPELRAAYEKELEWWGAETPGVHVIYGDLLNPHLDQALAADDTSTIRRVFDFIELLAHSPDRRLQDVVAVTICEHLRENPTTLGKARGYMGRATRKILKAVERS
jgi:hypothetical protein